MESDRRQCFIKSQYTVEKKIHPFKVERLFSPLQKILKEKKLLFKMPCPVTSLIFTFSLMLVATYWLSKHVSTVRGNFFPSFSWAFQKVDQYSLSGFLKTPHCLWFFFPKYLVWSWPSFELHLLRNGSVLPLWHHSLPPLVVLCADGVLAGLAVK